VSKLTALLHTHNDGLRLGRCLETLYPCDELVIVDHGSSDATLHIARAYGARIVMAHAGRSRHFAIGEASWFLCLQARESISEALAASLYEWKSERNGARAFSMLVREEAAGGWLENRDAETRLVPANWQRWNGFLPMHEASACVLQGEILRFSVP